jgi:hypothetical protein
MTLTDKEKELVVSCLLHTASVDVCINLTDKECKELVKIAKKFEIEDIKHAFVYGSEGYWDELGITETLFEDFNIRQETEEDK